MWDIKSLPANPSLPKSEQTQCSASPYMSYAPVPSPLWSPSHWCPPAGLVQEGRRYSMCRLSSAEERSTSLIPLTVSLLMQLSLWLSFTNVNMCFLGMCHMEVLQLFFCCSGHVWSWVTLALLTQLALRHYGNCWYLRTWSTSCHLWHLACQCWHKDFCTQLEFWCYFLRVLILTRVIHFTDCCGTAGRVMWHKSCGSASCFMGHTSTMRKGAALQGMSLFLNVTS